MRAIGPGSVSSFLKIVLDVAYAVVAVGVAGMALMALAAVLFSVNPSLLAHTHFATDSEFVDRAPIMVAGLLTGVAYMGGVVVILRALRRIFATLIAGDPFHPDNVARLRVVGLMLALLELGRYVIWGVSAWLPWVRDVSPKFSLTAWFPILTIFVLAEVFREGARLRREAELTI